MQTLSKKLIVGGIVLVITLAAGSFFWYASVQKKQAQMERGQMETVKQQQKDTSATEVQFPKEIVESDYNLDTSQWKTYRDEKMGFEVKYPGDIYRVDNSNITFLGIKFVAVNDEVRKKHGDILVLVTTLDSAIFTGKTPEEIALFKKEKYGESLSWKDAYVYGGMRWAYLSAEGATLLDKKFFSVDTKNESLVVTDCLKKEDCNISSAMNLFTSKSLFTVTRIASSLYNASPVEPVFMQFLSEFKPL